MAPGASASSEGIAQVLNEVERPDLLMLGMLLHDIGKGRGHGHVAKGIPLAGELAARIGLEGDVQLKKALTLFPDAEKLAEIHATSQIARNSRLAPAARP